MLELKNVCYGVYDKNAPNEKEILNNINISFPKNKITVITGHNGSGKSTLIKLIMGICKPTNGKIIFNENDITNLTVSERANLGFTIAFQQPIKFKGLTVKDLLKIANPDVNTIPMACEYLARVGLCAKDYIDRELDSSLSGGELKRIELALALCKGGDVFLFDEPEAGIDLWSFDELVKVFKSLKNKTIIIVSHQKKLIELADYILVMNSSSDVVFGTKKDILPTITSSKCEVLEDNNG